MPRHNGKVNNAALLTAALEGLEAQKRRIEEQIGQVQGMLGHRRGRPPAAQSESHPATAVSQRRPLSSAARKRIAAAQKRRWAEYRRKLTTAGKE